MELESLAQEFIFNMKYRRLSKNSISNYNRLLRYLFQYLKEKYNITRLEQVKPNHIKKFMLLKQEQGRKPQYINDLLKVYKVFFRYARDEEYTDTLITEKIKNVKQPKVIIRTFNKQEIKRMLQYYSGHDYISIRNKTILILLFDTGIRLNELITLKDNQILEDHLLINGKGDKQRVVPKSPYLSKWLIKYIRTRDAFFYKKLKGDSVFQSRYGDNICPTMVTKVIRDAGRFAHVSPDIRVSAHTIRHTFAQQCLLNGMNIYTLSRILGHENIAITQRYLEGMRDKEILKDAVNESPLMNL